MLANGSSLATVDDLPLDDAHNLYVTLQAGLWGPYGVAQANYTQFAQAHLSKETAVAIASGKKYKATPLIEFHKLYAELEDYQSLGAGKSSRSVAKAASLAKSALLSIPLEGAPKWLTSK